MQLVFIIHFYPKGLALNVLICKVPVEILGRTLTGCCPQGRSIFTVLQLCLMKISPCSPIRAVMTPYPIVLFNQCYSKKPKAPPPLPPHLCLSLVFASAVFISGSLETDFRAQSCMDFAPNKSRTPPATSALVKGAGLVGLMEQSQ